ncbi:MAG TPA: YetF domain-containing protein [Longimicrobiales bacterium]
MDSVIRGVIVYGFVLLIFRIGGKRALSSISTFDLVLTLIISETLQQAMINDDNSMTNAMLLVLTLIGIDIVMSLEKRRFPGFDQWADSVPAVIVKGGKVQSDVMRNERVDESDLISAAREKQGLCEIAEIDYAVLEKSGDITVIPKERA